jgi:hypothetical protein
LPGRGVRAGRIVESGGPGARQPFASNTVFGQKEVEDGGDFPAIGQEAVWDPALDGIDLAL